MSETWIKMRASLHGHVKVIRMVTYLDTQRRFQKWVLGPSSLLCNERVTEFIAPEAVTKIVVSGLLDVWSSVNEVICPARDFVNGLLVDEVEGLCGIPLFGLAMAESKWIVVTTGGLLFPNFKEYNAPKKARNAMTPAERQRARRKRLRNADVTAVTESHRHQDQDQNREELEPLIETDHLELGSKKSTSKDLTSSISGEPHVEAVLKRVAVAGSADVALIRRIAAMVTEGLMSEAQLMDAAEGVVRAPGFKSSPIAYFRKSLQNAVSGFEDLLSKIPAQGD